MPRIAPAAAAGAAVGLDPHPLRASPRPSRLLPPVAPLPRRLNSMDSSGLSSSSSSREGSSIVGGRRSRCRGFVGEGTRPAGEYHDAEFEWEELVPAGQAAIERQRLELEQHLQQQTGSQAGATAVASAAAAAAADCTSSAAADVVVSQEEVGDESWERFHAQHSQARFFKEKRYLMLEFPVLAVADPPQHIAEIGCGCGSALLPVLQANPTCHVTGCDISPTAVQLFRRAAEQAGVAADRIHTFVLDASSTSSRASSGDVQQCCSNGSNASASSASLLAGLEADSLLLIFTLSALAPEDHPAVLAHAFAGLRPGGLLLFRDYGLYDHAQLRFPGAQMLGENLYRRSEGTLAYFFSTEGLRSAAAVAGFEAVQCEYARVQLRNRKNGVGMRRVFVHGIFRKPLEA